MAAEPHDGGAARREPRRHRKLVLFALAAVLLGGLGSLCTVGFGDGAFSQGEYQLVFQDAAGTPVEGVRLQVVTAYGQDSFHYPVSDYTPSHVPASGADGALTFHHINKWHSPEYGGVCLHLFFFIPVGGGCHPPVYQCRCAYQGREVYRIRFNDLNEELPGPGRGPEVKRRWDAPSDSLPHFKNWAAEGELTFPVLRKTIMVQGVR
jgi:hypothetical protein